MTDFNKKTIIVFGGAGFIGSNFIRMILEKYPKVKVVNFDKLTYSGNLDNLKDIAKDKRYVFVKGDVANQKQVNVVFGKYKPDYIINFAAETHVDRSIHVGALEFVRTNVEGVFNILEAVKASKKIIKYVQVSTDEVYGSLPLDSKQKFEETTVFAPNVPYAATKAGGDLLCRSYFSTWKVPVVVTHCSNNYGPHQYPEKLIPFLVTRMLENKKLPMYGDGKNVRDWIYVLDHCRALELCLLNGKLGEVYNIGADSELDNLTIARMVLAHFKRDDSWLEYVADRPGHDRRYAIKSSKIRRELGWKPEYGFKKAFQETIDWYLTHQGWIDSIRKKTGVFNPHIDLWRAHKLKTNKKDKIIL
jgi:dTDP-glucose 4,6-dehydratase